jgi:catechol 2,3-dioxygenase
MWQTEGRELVSATNPVQLGELAALANEPWQGMPPATTVGHVHFYVGDLKQAASFYHEALGLDLVTWRYPGALFLSAGGYHHHVAVNTWAAGSPVASDADTRILFWEFILPTADDISEAAASLSNAGFKQQASPNRAPLFTDPWGISMLLVPEA